MKPTFDELVASYDTAKAEVALLWSLIASREDGFKYLSCLRCYGSITWTQHSNQFTTQELCDEYYGDNGIVDIYTTNPNPNIETYGTINILSEEDIISMSKEDISMSRAMCNWITP